jgi:hypothetical protein
MTTQTTPAGKCTNVTPVSRIEPNGQPRRYGICPECGGSLAILNSGFFRTHKPVMKPGNPQIAKNIEGQKPYVAANGNRFTPEQAKTITEVLRFEPAN